MSKSLLFFLSIISLSYSKAQSIQFADQETKAPIAFASIKAGKQIFYSSLEGKIEKRYLEKEVNFLISCIGYETREVHGPIKADTIFLVPQAVKIPEVEVKPLELRKVKKLGFVNKSAFPRLTFVGKDSLFLTIYIANTFKQPKQIKEILYAFKNVGESDQFVALLFNVDEEFKPNKVIHSKIVDTRDLRNKARINIAEDNVYLPSNGLFVGFLWKANDKSNKSNLYDELEVKMVDRIKDVPAFMHYKGEWVSLNPGVPRFGLTVYE
ncbi:MAG: hypothetical protein RIC95_06155 [Vicingaceae bacterium]